MKTLSLNSLRANLSLAYWRLAVVAGLALSPRPLPAQDNDLENLIGDDGTIRTTGRLVLDFGLWIATVIGCGMVIYGIYDGIKQSGGGMGQQKSYGKAVMFTIGGAALSGVRFIWEWVAQAITGESPTGDILLP